jgi:hypothetical protein
LVASGKEECFGLCKLIASGIPVVEVGQSESAIQHLARRLHIRWTQG